MNDKFKELIFKADFGDYDLWFHGLNFDKLLSYTVNECATVIQDLVDRRVPASEYPQRLREHFGSNMSD